MNCCVNRLEGKMLTKAEQAELQTINQKLGMPQKSGLQKAGKVVGMAGRSLAAFPGYLMDFYNLPSTLIDKALHKTTGIPETPYSYGETTKKQIDSLTNNYGKPTSDKERLAEAAFDVLGAGKVQAAKTLAKTLAKNAARKAPQIAGSVAGQHVLNEDPEDILGALGTGIVTGALTRKGNRALSNVPARLKTMAENDKLARLRHNPALKKKVLEQLGKEAGARKIEGVTNANAGDIEIKSAKNYKNKSEKVFGRLFDKSQAQLDKHISGKDNLNRYLNTAAAEKFALDQLLSLESLTAKKKFLRTPTGKQLKEILAIKRDKGSVTVREAEQIRRDIGNLTSTAGATGTAEQGQLRKMSGLLKEEIGKKYHAAGPRVGANWERTNKHYKLHKDKNVPKQNAILDQIHEPTASFSGSTEALKTGSSKPKFVSQYAGKDKDSYHRGMIFELGKKDNAFDPTTFHNNYRQLPDKQKSFLIKGLNPEDKKNMQRLTRQLRTVSGLENKIGLGEIASDFVPSKFKKLAHPLKTLKKNAHLSPGNVHDVTEIVKKRSTVKPYTPPTPKTKTSFDERTQGVARTVARANARESNLTPAERLELDEINNLLGEQHYMNGGQVGHQDDPYESDGSDADTLSNESNSVLGNNFIRNHILIDRGGDPRSRAVAIIRDRRKHNQNIKVNTVLFMTPKWKNRLLRDLKGNKVQNQLNIPTSGGCRNGMTDRPIKIKVVKTIFQGNNNYKTSITERKIRSVRVGGFLDDQNNAGQHRISHFAGVST